jgi:hypothetical protein
MKLYAYIIHVLFLFAVCVIVSLPAAANEPWRLGTALNLPDWLELSGTFRTRYESLESQFRADRNGGDQILVIRSTLKAAFNQGPLSLVAEMMDSRAALDDLGTPISTSFVNPVELLQGHLLWQANNVLGAGGISRLRAGRITMDIGSRRFVARNRFRNTMNAFTGIDLEWQSASGRKVRAFYTLPVNRKPSSVSKLRNNEIEFDEQGSDVAFWGMFVSNRLSWGDVAEFYYFGLDEDDSNGRATRNRELSTVGLRLFRKASAEKLDYQIESTVQFGESRTSTSTANVIDLDHFAHFQHVEVGYTFASHWHPRLVAQYDYASGDDNPSDRDNDRFDTLFGARRFDFGPTSIYGPFSRSNLSTPGLRLQLKPSANTTSFVAYRAYWLASDRDAWTTSRLRDTTGGTGKFVAQQVEIRVRWNVDPSNVRLEAGLAHLFAGEFIDDAPNSNRQGDSTYLYTQLALTF